MIIVPNITLSNLNDISIVTINIISTNLQISVVQN